MAFRFASRLVLASLLIGCTSSSLPPSFPDSGPTGSSADTAAQMTALPDAAPLPPLPDAWDVADLGSVGDAVVAQPDGEVLKGDASPMPVVDAAGDQSVPLPIDVAPPGDLPPPIDQIYPPRFEALPDAPPAPPPNPDSKLLVPGRARLVGTHFTACTNSPGAGDRWCAFSLPNRQIGLTDLWVINVTRALAGTDIKCDGTDANCKLMIPPGSTAAMGTQLWTDQPMSGPIHPTTHRFDGDTLIFHAQAGFGVQDQYSGPIFGWRPNWDAPRQLSLGKTAYSCSAHITAESFVCIENLTTQQPLQFDLTGGNSSTGPKPIKHIVPFRAGNQSSQWRAALTRDGSMLAFSTGGLTVAERETLYTVRFDVPGVVTTLKVGASRWAISADGTKVYFLANYNYDTMGAPAGTLTMMDFPSGANEKVLAPGVGALQVLAEGDVDKGVGFFDNVIAGKATYKIMSDRNVPSQVITVVTNIGGVLALTRDLRLLYFYKDFNMDNGSTTDGYVVKTDGSQTTCALSTNLNSDQFGASFTRNGAMIFWADNIDQINGVGEGWVANPDGCTGARKFADGIDFWFFRGNDGMVYSDQGMLDYSTLEVATFPGGNSISAPTVVQTQVNRIFAIVGDFKGLIYQVVNSPPEKDGLVLYTKLPF
jgi:hypothetical protein